MLSDHHNGQLRGHGPNDNPGSRDFNTPNQQTSPDTHAPRVSLILVTRDLLDKPTGGVTNTMDKAPLGTLLTDDLGGGDLNAGLWWAGADYAARPYVHDCGELESQGIFGSWVWCFPFLLFSY